MRGFVPAVKCNEAVTCIEIQRKYITVTHKFPFFSTI